MLCLFSVGSADGFRNTGIHSRDKHNRGDYRSDDQSDGNSQLGRRHFVERHHYSWWREWHYFIC